MVWCFITYRFVCIDTAFPIHLGESIYNLLLISKREALLNVKLKKSDTGSVIS